MRRSTGFTADDTTGYSLRTDSLGVRRMLQIKLGVELASLRLPLKKGLLTARELGAEAVEIDLRNELRPEDLSRTGVRQVRKMLDDLNLRISAVALPHPPRLRRRSTIWKPGSTPPSGPCCSAYELGTNVVINHIGRVPPESDSAATSTLVQALADLGRYGQKVGALLAAETGTETGDRTGQPDRPAAARLDRRRFQPRQSDPARPFAARRRGSSRPHVLHMHATDATRDLASGPRPRSRPSAKATPNFPSCSPCSKSSNTAATSPSPAATATHLWPTSIKHFNSCEISRLGVVFSPGGDDRSAEQR